MVLYNGLVQYLRNVLSGTAYKPQDIAVFLDASQSTNNIAQLLKKQMPDVIFETAADFPRKGIVVDSVDSFLGLDATICIFTSPPMSRRFH